MRKEEEKEKEIMEIQSNGTRRRRRVTEIQSGTTDDDENDYDDDDDGGGGIEQEQDRRRRQRNKRRYRRQRRHDGDEQPFFILFLQVGTILLLVCLATFHIYQYTSSNNSNRVMSTNDNAYGDDDDYDYDAVNAMKQQDDKKELKLNELLHPTKKQEQQSQNNDDIDEENIIIKAPIRKTAPPLPTFELSKSAEWDVFSTFNKFSPLLATENNNLDNSNNEPFWQAVRELQKNFTEIYGGENAARMLLDRGMTTFRNGTGNSNSNSSTNTGTSTPLDVVTTACRLRQAKFEQRPFVFSFGGYSVTTGHGNRHIDSYPFQLKEFLEPIIKLAGIVSLKVNNAAIGGVPSFPYGWCMKEFWGGETDDAVQSIPDVVSWDFGMNEPGGPEGLEAYVRHLLSTYNSNIGPPPKLIVKDYFAANHRKEVLAEYSSHLRDPVILHTDVAAKPFLAREEEFRPLGFQKWREWGAPKGSPGQAPHHPAVREHKLNGYILALHFVTALEYMIYREEREGEDSNLVDTHNWCQQQSSTITLELLSSGAVSSLTPFFSLPPPVSSRIANDTKLHYDGILFGNPMTDQSIGNNNNVTSTQNGTFVPWIMNPVRCRTTFEPKLSGDLSEIIVSGSIGEDLDVLLPKSQYYYNKGWTFDLSEAEKTAKKKLSVYPNGLGFRDSKEAYYGIYESSTMTLLLPYETTENVVGTAKAGDSASEFYESVVICQVNEKSLNSFDSDSCNFDTDVGVRIGGINVTQNNTKMFDTIGSVYLGKPICKHVTIPSKALLTSHNTLLHEGEDPTPGVVGQTDHTNLLDKDQTGLLVEVFVSNPHIVHINQACSISHVVWEEKAT